MNDLLNSVLQRQQNMQQWLDTPSSSGNGDTFDFAPVVNRLRSAVRVKDAQCEYDDPASKLEGVDPKKMSARFLVSAVSEDRYGDVVIPQGCKGKLPNYEKNPRVFFGHKSSGFSVGSARDPDSGMMAVDVANDIGIYSTCYFHCQTLESEQTLRLVEAKELETASIGFMPILGKLVKMDEDEDENAPKNQVKFGPWCAYVFEEWELYEWSIVAVPANADCIAMRLSRGLGGKQLAKGIESYLRPFAAPARDWANGFTKGFKEPDAPWMAMIADCKASIDALAKRLDEKPVVVPEPVPVPVVEEKAKPVDSELIVALRDILGDVKAMRKNQDSVKLEWRKLTGQID